MLPVKLSVEAYCWGEFVKWCRLKVISVDQNLCKFHSEKNPLELFFRNQITAANFDKVWKEFRDNAKENLLSFRISQYSHWFRYVLLYLLYFDAKHSRFIFWHWKIKLTGISLKIYMSVYFYAYLAKIRKLSNDTHTWNMIISGILM